MFTDQIEKLKNQYTDKYVVVDSSRPELARFRDVTGQVKTVNMSGRALVEFQDYHVNIGWYDIDPEFLKVVDKPLPKAEKPKAEKKPAPAKAEAKPTAVEASAKPAAPKPAAAGKMSVAEMLAAARGGKAATPAAQAAPKAEAAKSKAVTPPAKAQPAAKVDRSKMSVADMLAAARGDKSGGGAAAPAAKPQTATEPEAAAPAEETPPPSEAEAPAPAKAGPLKSGIVKIDRSMMSVADMLAYARKSDGQR